MAFLVSTTPNVSANQASPQTFLLSTQYALVTATKKNKINEKYKRISKAKSFF